jgi:hypothetical protein
MGMKCQAFFMYAEVIQQGRTVARILAGDSINRIEHMQCAQGDIA